MAKRPLISVVMPAYNAEKYISQAIESILNQSLTNFELLIINDGSTDSTLRIVRSFRDKRIRVVTNRKNLKIAKSLNKAVRLSKAGLIARMDADDISLPDRLEKQYRLLSERPGVAIVGANMIIVDEDGRRISKREYPSEDGELKRLMFRYSPFGHPVVVFRKKAFMEFGGYDPTKVPCEDIDLWFRLGSRYNFATVPEYLIKYRILKFSTSHSKLRDLELLGFKVKLNAITQYGYRPSFYDVVYNFGQFITLWLTPASMRVWMYNFLRSRNLI